MTTFAFTSAERAYYTPPESPEIDELAVPTTSECAAGKSDAEIEALKLDCVVHRCAFCDKPVCEDPQHSTGDAEYNDTCEGAAHDSCHRRACRLADCWWDDSDADLGFDWD